MSQVESINQNRKKMRTLTNRLIIIPKQIETNSHNNNQFYSSHQNQPQAPSTPKKIGKFKLNQQTTPSRIKRKYTVIETTQKNAFFTFLFFIFIIWILAIIGCQLYDKYNQIQIRSIEQKKNCLQDFIKNKCQNPLKDLIKYCSQKKICMDSSIETLMAGKLKMTQLVGQILRQFIDGAGLLGIAAIFIFLIINFTIGKNKEVKKEYIEYR